MAGNRTALPALPLHQHIEVNSFHAMHKRAQGNKFCLFWRWCASMMAPDATAEFGDKREACGASKETHGLDCPPIALLVTIEIHADPIDLRLGLHARDIQWCAILKGHIMEDRDAHDASLPQHMSDTRHTPANLVLFVGDPVPMPG